MFEIEYKGANTMIVTAQGTKLVINPRLSLFGEKDIVVQDGISLATEPQLASTDEKFKLNISVPGSYEVSNFSINGFAAKPHSSKEGEKSIVYNIDIDGVKIGLIGNIDPDMPDSLLESLGVLDIVILPVGGQTTIGAKQAVLLAKQTDAKIIIPVRYADDGINYPIENEAVDTLSQFMDAVSIDKEETAKFKLKSVNSLPENPTVVAIKRTK